MAITPACTLHPPFAIRQSPQAAKLAAKHAAMAATAAKKAEKAAASAAVQEDEEEESSSEDEDDDPEKLLSEKEQAQVRVGAAVGCCAALAACWPSAGTAEVSEPLSLTARPSTGTAQCAGMCCVLRKPEPRLVLLPCRTDL